jgi:predicted ester cyclase
VDMSCSVRTGPKLHQHGHGRRAFCRPCLDWSERRPHLAEDDNKAIVGRWFTDFWGKTCNLSVVDEIAAPDMLLKYSLHEPRKGREDIKAFMTDFRAAFPNLNFWGTADLIAEGDCVVGQWEGGGIHTGPAFKDFLAGGLPANTGRKMHFTGVTVLKLKDGKIIAEIGLDDGVTALTQLGLLRIV